MKRTDGLIAWASYLWQKITIYHADPRFSCQRILNSVRRPRYPRYRKAPAFLRISPPGISLDSGNISRLLELQPGLLHKIEIFIYLSSGSSLMLQTQSRCAEDRAYFVQGSIGGFRRTYWEFLRPKRFLSNPRRLPERVRKIYVQKYLE